MISEIVKMRMMTVNELIPDLNLLTDEFGYENEI